MGKILDFMPEDAAIKIEPGEEFIESSQIVSEFIGRLPLTVEQNDKLVYLLAEHVAIAREDACRFGAMLWASLSCDYSEERPEGTTIH